MVQIPYKVIDCRRFPHHRQHGQDGLNSVQYGHLRGCGGSQLGGERSTVYARAACRRNGVGRSGTRPTRARGGGGRRRQWRLGKGARRAINGGEWRGPAPPFCGSAPCRPPQKPFLGSYERSRRAQPRGAAGRSRGGEGARASQAPVFGQRRRWHYLSTVTVWPILAIGEIN